MAFDCEIFPSDGIIYIHNTEDDGNEPFYERICAYLVSSDNTEVPKLFEAISEKAYTEEPGTLYIHVSSNDSMAFRRSLVDNGLKIGFKKIHRFNNSDWCFLNAIVNVERELIIGDIVFIFTRESILHQMCCHIWEIGYRNAMFKGELKFDRVDKEDFDNALQKYFKKPKQKPIILASWEVKKSLESIFDELIYFERMYLPGNVTKSWNRIPIEQSYLREKIRVEIDGHQTIEFSPQSQIPAKQHVELFKYVNFKLKIFYADQQIVEKAFPKGNVILLCEVDAYGILTYEIIYDFRILLLDYDEMYLYDLEQTSPVMKLDKSNGTFNERLDQIKESLKDDNCRILVAALPGILPTISSSNWYCMDSIGVLLLGYQKKYQSKKGEYFIVLYGGASVYVVDDSGLKLVNEAAAFCTYGYGLEFKNYNHRDFHTFFNVSKISIREAFYAFFKRLGFKKYDREYIYQNEKQQYGKTKIHNHVFNLQIESLLPNGTNATDTPTKITIFNFECEVLRHEYTITDAKNYNIVKTDPKEYKDLLLDGFLDAKAVQLFEDNAILHDTSGLWEEAIWEAKY